MEVLLIRCQPEKIAHQPHPLLCTWINQSHHSATDRHSRYLADA